MLFRMLGSYTNRMGTCGGCCMGRFKRYAKHWVFDLAIGVIGKYSTGEKMKLVFDTTRASLDLSFFSMTRALWSKDLSSSVVKILHRACANFV